MEKLEFKSIKDTEILSDEVMNEVEGAQCADSCTHSCKKKKSKSDAKIVAPK